MSPSAWAALAAAGGSGSIAAAPPAPTQAQLDAVNSGQITPDQLLQQLANQQAQQQKANDASQVAPVTDPYSVAGSVLPGAFSATDTAALCAQNIMPPFCDSTLYWIGGIAAGILVLWGLKG